MQELLRRILTPLVGASVGAFVVITLIVITVFAFAGDSSSDKQVAVREVATVEIVKVEGGYTYFKYREGAHGFMAPTPNTIERCLREVLKDRSYKVIDADDRKLIDEIVAKTRH